MKKQILKSALIAMAGVGLLAGSAMALEMTITDGHSSVNVTDDNNDGFVFYNQITTTPFTGWTTVSSNGFSNPVLSNGSINLQSLDVTAAGTVNSLTITLTDEYEGDFSGFTTRWNPSINNGFSVDFYVTITDTVTNFSWNSNWDNIATTGNFVNSISTLSSNNQWRITQQLILTKNITGSATFSVDATTSPVPEPGTMLLLGTGLAGLAAVGRRRKSQA